MRGGALPPGLLAAALGLALAFGPRRVIIPAATGFLVLAAVVAQFRPDPSWSDPIFYACWGSVILASGAAMAPGRRGALTVMLLAINAGLWAGAVSGVAAQPRDLLFSLPWVLISLPAAWLADHRGSIAVKIAASWLIAVCALATALPLTTPTPGYVRGPPGVTMPAAKRLKIAFAAGLISAGLCLPAVAHDFWVQPLSFWIAPNTAVLTSLQVGHGEARQRWNADAARVTRFNDVGPGGKLTDHQKELRAGSMDDDHLITLGAIGTHVMVMETSHADSTLPAIRFNDYIKEEGLAPAMESRARTKATESPGREIYSRRAKALVQVGPPSDAAQPWVTKPVGLSLEIVPEINPYALAAKGMLPVYVLYEGRRLAGATMKLNNLAFDGRPLETAVTDAQGRATFKIPRTGVWQLNVIWTKPLRGDAKADFDTTFSSLTLGFPPRMPLK